MRHTPEEFVFLTSEDECIWRDIQLKRLDDIIVDSALSDRRDARLMKWAQREHTAVTVYSIYAKEWIAVRGGIRLELL